MAVGIGLSESGPIAQGDNAAGVGFEDDGYYWYLFPYFEDVAKQTGQFIDPYGDAEFDAATLPYLLTTLERAAGSLRRKPKEWKVRIGWRGQQEVFEKVSKATLQRMLRDFIALVKRAMETKQEVVCFGA